LSLEDHDASQLEAIRRDRRRLWALVLAFATVPVMFAILTGQDNTAIVVAALLLSGAFLIGRRLGSAPCPHCGRPFFVKDVGGLPMYNAFTSSTCKSCGWSLGTPKTSA
jgi:hypothetical protein